MGARHQGLPTATDTEGGWANASCDTIRYDDSINIHVLYLDTIAAFCFVLVCVSE